MNKHQTVYSIFFVLILIGSLTMYAPIDSSASVSEESCQWYRADTHAHSVVSSDGSPDLGVISERAKAAGYNAIFLSDHNLASAFSISRQSANHFVFEDSYTRWNTKTFGSLSSKINTLATSPVNTGTKSLHLMASSNSYGEAFAQADRGPNFRSGIILKVSIYPKRIDPLSGIYVSASIGGDPTVRSPIGYTTQDGIISLGKSTALVWQLGQARQPSADPNRRVLVFSLGQYVLNAWNTYTVDVSAALADIPLADRPLDYNALTDLKITAAASNGGTADAYFDTYSIDASPPLQPSDEFVYRNRQILNYDTSTFKIFASVEMGIHKHANRFNFHIDDPSQFASYPDGIDGILPTQLTGYPVQLNHPGSPGGVRTQEAIDTQGAGADLLEVKQSSWISIWDGILKQGVQILGTGSTDKHKASWSSSSTSTYICASTLDFDPLIRSLFEGKTFVSEGFSGPVIFNLKSQSRVPYAARYPVYVPDSSTTADVHLLIPSGLKSDYRVRWVRNGEVFATDSVPGSSYEATKSIPLAGAFTYIRAEVRTSGGSLRAMTQPIFFRLVPALPADKSYHIEDVSTPDGRGYNRIMTRGITSSSWSGPVETLSLALENQVGSLARILISTKSGPQVLRIGGLTIPRADSPVTFETSTGSLWFFDPVRDLLYLKVLQEDPVALVSVVFAGALPPDTTPPSVPTGLSAVAVSPTQVDLQWIASTDDGGSGVVGYDIFRDGSYLKTTGLVTAYSDPSVSPSSTYEYRVRARDGADNFSPLSEPAIVSTPAPPPLITLKSIPTHDTFIEADSPNTISGSSAKLEVDASPLKHILFQFTVSGVAGRSVTSAKLRLHVVDSGGGGDIHAMTNDWGEGTTTWNNAPGYDAAIIASLGSVIALTWVEVDLTLVLAAGDGTYSLRITSLSSNGADYSSKEAGVDFAPHLLITVVD